MEKANIYLEEVSCPSCVKKIESALTKVTGVESAKMYFHSSKVKVDYDEKKTSHHSLEKVIQDLGYVVKK
jgi:copper chaperone